MDKQFFPTRSFLVLLTWTTISACKRVVVLVCFFAPSFGLFSLLHHWRAEQIPFAVRQSRAVTPSDLLQLYNTTPVLWSQVDRWDWEENNPPSYTWYTGLTVGQYFGLFWVLVSLHTTSLYLLKLRTAPAFRRNNSLMERLVHCLRAINLPSVFEDWDGPHGTVEDYRRRHRQVNIEMVSTIFLNLTFNGAMLVPLLFTGKQDTQLNIHYIYYHLKLCNTSIYSTINLLILLHFKSVDNIWRRHDILRKTIGTLEKENFSTEMATQLFQLTLSIFLLFSVFEIALFLVYNHLVKQKTLMKLRYHRTNFLGSSLARNIAERCWR